VSPDGSLIAVRMKGDEPGLYVMNRDGTGFRKLADATQTLAEHGGPAEGNASFAWSPDSTRIAFISPLRPTWPPSGTGNGHLYVVNVGTGATAQIVQFANGSISWSPDGSMLAFGRSDVGRSHVVIANADGTQERVYTPSYDGAAHPGGIDWSPDGSRVAFAEHRFSGTIEGDYVMSMDSNAQNVRELAYEELSGCCAHGPFVGQLEWSPNGELLAVPGLSSAGSTDAPKQVVRLIASDGSTTDVEGDWFDWSPDGRQLVVTGAGPLIDGASEGSSAARRRTSIYVVNADGSNRRWIADGDYPAWAPGSR